MKKKGPSKVRQAGVIVADRPSPVSGFRRMPSRNTRATPGTAVPMVGPGRGYYAG